MAFDFKEHIQVNSIYQSSVGCNYLSIFLDKLSLYKRPMAKHGARASAGTPLVYMAENISHPTHWDQNEMLAILQTTFPNIFSAMKCFVFWLNFRWNLFPWDELPISMCNICSNNGLVLRRPQANTWISGDTDYWCYMVSLGQNESTMVYNELTHCGLGMPHGDKTGGQHCLR